MNRPIILVFPGQASQYVGMGRDLYLNSPAARAVMDQAASMDGLKGLPDLCFQGPEDLLTRTDNVQPAITTVSMMALAAMRERAGDFPVAAAGGHSLGEYCAHFAAGTLSAPQTLHLVAWRGRWMNEASQPPYPAGAMVAVMGLELQAVEEMVVEVGRDRVSVANLNSPGQIILSGEREAVEQADQVARRKGAKRTVMLKVSGAWHSPLMRPAQVKMAQLLERELTEAKVQFNPALPVVANVTADVVRTLSEMRKTLSLQITSPVRWVECALRLEEVAKSSGETPLFVEVGPGRVLKGLLRNINREWEVLNVEDSAGVEAFAGLAAGHGQ